MKETLLEWRSSVVAIQTMNGNSFEGFLRKVEAGCLFIEVKDKGTFCCPLEYVALAVKVSQVALAKEIKIN